MRISGLEFENTIVLFQISIQKFVLLERQKNLNFKLKMPTLGNYGLEFENIFAILEISVLERVLMQSFMQETILKFRTINFWFEYFWVGIWKWNCHIWNQHPQICLILEFNLQIKFLKFGTKMPYLSSFGLEFERSYVIFEISTLEFVWLKNFKKKAKCINLRLKMPYLGHFWLQFEKNIVIFEIATLEFVYLQNFNKKQKCLNLDPKMSY